MKEKLLREVIDKAYQASLGWRNWMETAHVDPEDMEEEEDLEGIPIMRREQLLKQQELRPPLGCLETIPIAEFSRIFSSTWGGYIPQRDKHNFGFFAEALAAVGFGEDDVVWNTISMQTKPLSSMVDSGLQKLGSTVISIEFDKQIDLVRSIQEWGITGFIGSPQTLSKLLEAFQTAQIQDGRVFQLEKFFVLGGMVPPMLLKKVERYEMRLAEGYAIEELGCIAYREERDFDWKVCEHVIVHLCDPVSGTMIYNTELGEIVVTVLDTSYPLIRYGTGELAKWMEGKQGERFIRIFGNVDESVVIGTRIIHPLQIHKILKLFTEVEYFQGNILTDSLVGDYLLLQIESTIQIQSFKEIVSQRLKDELRVSLKVEFVPVHSLDRNQRQLFDQRK
ncbi:MAG TPA: hypothetical protein VJ824_12245 [Bacillota bacterium]|nr:hypothetical protein [Bacillota bacterium]